MTAPTLFDQTPAAGPTTRPAAVTQRPLVIGLDVAMGTTGVAGVGWTDYVHTAAKGQHDRFAYQLDGCASFYRNADFVVIEGAAYSKNNQGADALAAMRWMVRHDLWKRSIPYAIVPPDKRISYATGTTVHKDETGARVKGTALKDLVRTAVADRYGIHTEGKWRYDEADAYVLLAMGLDHIGHPLAPVPARNAKALDGCTWPQLVAVAA